MPRRRKGPTPQPLRIPRGIATTERRPDGREYQVQRDITGTKEYRCPGCGRTIAPGTVQVVAWPSRTQGWAGVGVEGRRHWHTGCWDRGL